MSTTLFVVDRLKDWTFDIEGTQAVTARDYLTEPVYSSGADYRVINLCRCDRYQGQGYYVSLLAEARGHAPLLRALTREVDALLENAVVEGDTEEVRIDAYFGRDPTGKRGAVVQQLFALVKVPLLRATFVRKERRFRLKALKALFAAAIPNAHRGVFEESARLFLSGGAERQATPRVDRGPRIAILYNPGEVEPSSDQEAIERFRAAARTLGMQAEIIDRRAIARLPEFDALFIRDTTNVGHYTYESARRAHTSNLVVVDDPDRSSSARTRCTCTS